MAERIDSVAMPHRANRLYPWEEWADGSAWLIRKGEDFTCRPANMRAVLGNRAIRMGLRVTTHITSTEPDVIRFQFYKEETQ